VRRNAGSLSDHGGLRTREEVGPTSPCCATTAGMNRALACNRCGHPVVAAKNDAIPAARAAKMFPVMACKCGNPVRVWPRHVPDRVRGRAWVGRLA
jgi:hypothetical protein